MGVPLFDVEGWPSDRYVDTRTSVLATRLSSDELVVSIADSDPVRRLRLGEGLCIGLDPIGEVAELILGPLDIEQWRTIAAASP
jgi:hypothetical protein